jgi:putative endonuclease
MASSTRTSPTAAADGNAAAWTLYLLECIGGSYYAGITNNLAARIQAHRDGRGAKYTRANKPLKVLATREYPDRSAASKAEWALKQLPRQRKMAFFLSPAPNER